MAASVSAAAATITAKCRLSRIPAIQSPTYHRKEYVLFVGRTERAMGLRKLVLRFVTEKSREIIIREEGDERRGLEEEAEGEMELMIPVVNERLKERTARKRKERVTYLLAAVLSSLGVTSMAASAVYYRFHWQFEGGEVPMAEMVGTFALSVGAAVGMEFWARWAHRELWHASMWSYHESHHRPRDGPFELNDVFAIINAVPAIALLAYGFFHKDLVAGLCFGAGLGITVFGIAYMFVHDGLVHRRFPALLPMFLIFGVWQLPIRYFGALEQNEDLQLHHADKFKGVPYGLFLGPKELEDVGGLEELEKEIQRRIKAYNNTSS